MGVDETEGRFASLNEGRMWCPSALRILCLFGSSSSVPHRFPCRRSTPAKVPGILSINLRKIWELLLSKPKPKLATYLPMLTHQVWIEFNSRWRRRWRNCKMGLCHCTDTRGGCLKLKRPLCAPPGILVCMWVEGLSKGGPPTARTTTRRHPPMDLS